MIEKSYTKAYAERLASELSDLLRARGVQPELARVGASFGDAWVAWLSPDVGIALDVYDGSDGEPAHVELSVCSEYWMRCDAPGIVQYELRLADELTEVDPVIARALAAIGGPSGDGPPGPGGGKAVPDLTSAELAAAERAVNLETCRVAVDLAISERRGVELCWQSTDAGDGPTLRLRDAGPDGFDKPLAPACCTPAEAAVGILALAEALLAATGPHDGPVDPWRPGETVPGLYVTVNHVGCMSAFIIAPGRDFRLGGALWLGRYEGDNLGFRLRPTVMPRWVAHDRDFQCVMADGTAQGAIAALLASEWRATTAVTAEAA